MNKAVFELKMAQHQKDFDALIEKINNDVIEFSNVNPSVTTHDLKITPNFVDYGVQSFGWINDKINGTLKTEKPNKSMVKKLRKVLGFTQP